MGTNYSEYKEFSCDNDCRMEGCPGHKMRLSYSRTSDIYTIEIDGKNEYYLDMNKYSTLKYLMNNWK